MVERQEMERGMWEGISVLQLVHALLRRKMLIIVITAATAILSCCYSLTLPNIYAATAKVLPPIKENVGVSAMLGQMGGVAGMAAGIAKGNENELYISLLKSRSVEEGVVQRLNLLKKYGTSNVNLALRRLDAAVKVQSGRDGILVVTAEDADPKHAALLANTLVDQLGRTMVRLNLTKAGAERLFLEKRLELVKKDMQAAENDLKVFAQRNKIAQVETQANATVSGVARLKGELDSKETLLAVLRTSQSEESFEVKEAKAAIQRLRQRVAEVAGRGGGDGVPSLGDVPHLGLEYTRKMRDLKTQEALYEQLTKQYEMAKLNEAKDSSSLQVLDAALPPEEKVRPHRSTLVMMSTLVALLSSVVLAFALECLERMPDENRKVLEDLKTQALSLR